GLLSAPTRPSSGESLHLVVLVVTIRVCGHSFLVIGPSEPIVAMLGADTVLPCRVSPAMSVENMELRWFRSQFSEAVYVYQDGMEQTGEQLVDFKGRAELVKDYIAEGRVAVRIHSLRISDNGMYKCFFKKGSDYEEAILELKVIGLGSAPHIFMVGPEDEGIRLTCTGKGWFPQPEVQWKDAKGEKLPSLSEDETQDDDGLFQIEASLIVRDSSKREVFCSMKNPFFGQEQEATISIPEPFFPRTSPWKVAFAVTFLILGIFVGAVMFLAWKEQQEKKRVREAMEEKEKESKFRRHGLGIISHMIFFFLDWRKEQFEEGDGKRVSSIENVPQNCDAPTHQGQGESETIFSVLGQNSFTTGRHYWEVEVKTGTEVGPGTRWALGVCSDTVKREGWFVESTEKNFWVIIYKDGEIRTLTSRPQTLSLRQHSHRIGVFLDWEAGDVSFYNMVDGSHIYSFAEVTFCGILHPYFSLQGPGTSITICLASDCTENCPDSSPKTSLTHLRSCDMDVPQEANSLLPL
uniref:Butyrophilin subfamily 1 member A1 n=1 Tax=Equus caballus TaxID=9796 RepID=F6WQH3_HORSE